MTEGTPLRVTLLTGGADKSDALGLTSGLIEAGVQVDFIGSDYVDAPFLHDHALVRFLNLRGDQRSDVSLLKKILRVLRYYARLLHYAAVAEPTVFHILWNSRLELFDRTLLMLYYRLLGKRTALTAHNINARERDGGDSVLNRLTLRMQYQLIDHIFVHTEKMRRQLGTDFGVSGGKVSIIPFGVNHSVPETTLTRSEARRQLGLTGPEKTILFFGNIAPYKGVEYLVEAMILLARSAPDYRLVIAGRPKGSEAYWETIHQRIVSVNLQSSIIERIEYVADEDTELYFKAADVLALPYTHIFQSGVLFLGYNFGLPAIASDVGSFRDDIVEGETGFVCSPRDPGALAQTITRFFSSDLYRQSEMHRQAIRAFAHEHHSWAKVAAITQAVYAGLDGSEESPSSAPTTAGAE
jgi:glycosyltransferase involved in cell wall biosynthesis